MNIKSHDNKFLMKNYQKIVKNCNESLEKYKISQQPSSLVAGNNEFKSNLKQANVNTHVSVRDLKHKLQYGSFENPEDTFYKLVQRPWMNVIPPIWDDGLTQSYVESIVDELISSEKSTTSTDRDSEKSITITQEPRKELLKTDQAILVKESDFPTNDKVQAEWKPFKKEKKKPPKRTISPIKQLSPQKPIIPKTKIITPLLKPPEIARYRKSPEKNIPLSARRKKPEKILQPQNRGETFKSSGKYLRFIGKPRRTPFDFNAEHPGLFILTETPATTSFPCRLTLDRSTSPAASSREKSKVDEVADEKSNLLTKESTVELGSDESFTMKNDKFNATTELNKTWHEVLSEKLTARGKKDGQILKYMWIDSAARSADKQSSRKETEMKQDDMKEGGSRDVIYDSHRIFRVNEKQSPKSLQVQKLPVLCIRGACKVQKVVEISITANGEDTYKLDKDGNVNFLQCCHSSLKERQSTPYVPITLSENVQPKIVDQEIEIILNSTRSKSNRSDSFVERKAEIPQIDNELPKKIMNKYLAPFITVDCSDIKVKSSSEQLQKSKISGTSNESSTIEVSQSSSNVNDSDMSTTQTDDEKLKKRNSLIAAPPTLSLSSSTFPQTTSDDFQSNKIRDSLRTLPSSSRDVRQHLFNGVENAQITLKHPKDVRNILKEVLSLSDSEDDDENNLPRCKQTEQQKRMLNIGIDCTDLTPGIEMSVQTEDILDNYSNKQMGLDTDELAKGSADEDIFVNLRSKSLSSRQSKQLVNEIVKKICKDETEGLRNFKTRSANPFNHQSETNDPSKLTHSKGGNVNASQINEKTTTVEYPINEPITENNEQPLGNRSVNELIQVETSADLVEETNVPGGGDNTFEIRNDNYTDNRKVIKGDDVEHKYYHQFNELSSSCSLESHCNLLGRKCYCFYHRTEECGVKDTSEIIKKPLIVLYDNNLPSSSNSVNCTCAASTIVNSRKSNNYKEFQRTVLQQNPRFAKTITRIYDAAPKIATATTTTKSSSNRIDPEVQRAVKKFLLSLTPSEPPKSTHCRKYSTTMFHHRDWCTDDIDNIPKPIPPPSLNGQTSKRWTSTSTTRSSSVSSSSPKHLSGLCWKSSNDSSISDTESSELHRLLDASLWNEHSIKTTTTTRKFSTCQPKRDNPRSLTDSLILSITSPRAAKSLSSSHHLHSVRKGVPVEDGISEGEVLSLGEVGDFDS